MSSDVEFNRFVGVVDQKEELSALNNKTVYVWYGCLTMLVRFTRILFIGLKRSIKLKV